MMTGKHQQRQDIVGARPGQALKLVIFYNSISATLLGEPALPAQEAQTTQQRAVHCIHPAAAANTLQLNARSHPRRNRLCSCLQATAAGSFDH
ncbi:hypothetical protein OEZ85_004609 [Tetradesmus obliquus]|uniref:Uncharacterized protein n=1 Tax=Tetradesmus obliquus TaxID=3088 RepID=A0ABY8UPT6_TETOB|nr:hypothetical protein OEZ85_004609 [Tetradesmus obliquus]